MKLAPVLAGIGLVAVLPAVSFAADNDYSASSSGDEARHHSPGLMLRYTVGGSYARTGQSFDTVGKPKYHISGAAVDMSLAAGVALSNNFAVHGTAMYWQAFKPKATGEFAGLSASTSVDDSTLRSFGLGGGITAWFANNMYFSTSVAATMLRSEVADYKGDTNWGIGGEVLLGKEWWVANGFGVGVAAAGTWHFIADGKDDRNPLVGFTAGGRLSLTLN